jgi:activator of HSP90 ATPase
MNCLSDIYYFQVFEQEQLQNFVDLFCTNYHIEIQQQFGSVWSESVNVSSLMNGSQVVSSSFSNTQSESNPQSKATTTTTTTYTTATTSVPAQDEDSETDEYSEYTFSLFIFLSLSLSFLYLFCLLFC